MMTQLCLQTEFTDTMEEFVVEFDPSQIDQATGFCQTKVTARWPPPYPSIRTRVIPPSQKLGLIYHFQYANNAQQNPDGEVEITRTDFCFPQGGFPVENVMWVPGVGEMEAKE